MEGAPIVLQLVDLSRVGAVTADARKAASAPPDVNVVGTAMFGASFHVRMLSKLATTASAVLLKAKPTDMPVRFFDAEAEAVAWIQARRAEVMRGRHG
jgi:hypothetical protein